MSTLAVRTALTIEPVLVSEIPAVAVPPSRPSLWTRLREDLATRRDCRSFERAIRNADVNEAHDLFAARRRD